MDAVTVSELPTDALPRGAPLSSAADRFEQGVTPGASFTPPSEPSFVTNATVVGDQYVYELTADVVDETSVTEYPVEVNPVEGEVSEETVAVAELPAVDRRHLRETGMGASAPSGSGTSVRYNESQRAASELVPAGEPLVLVWPDGSKARWVVDGAVDGTDEDKRYTVKTAVPIAEYGRRLREHLLFELSGLSDTQRQVVDTAIEDRYTVDTETPTPAFQALTDRFTRHPQLDSVDPLDEDTPTDQSGFYLAEYDGQMYVAEMLV